LAVDVRLHHIWKAGHSHLRNEAEPGSRSRITADAFASSGFDSEVALAAAESASWRTSNSHGQFLSTDEINQAS
jgi:hypothetical protein